MLEKSNGPQSTEGKTVVTISLGQYAVVEKRLLKILTFFPQLIFTRCYNLCESQ